jgi:hypothetical protein
MTKIFEFLTKTEVGMNNISAIKLTALAIILVFSGAVMAQEPISHLVDNATSAATALLPDCRASPLVSLFD